jgi:outer membrane biosynthesis protein TonB
VISGAVIILKGAILVVLATLDKYIEERSAGGRSLLKRHTQGATLRRGRRFGLLLVLSAIGHLIAGVGIIKLDRWMLQKVARRFSADSGAWVKVIELAPPPNPASGIRRAPEHFSRADISHLSLDRADDTQLVSRSPRPTAHKSEGSLPDGRQIEQQLAQLKLQPPLPQTVQINTQTQPAALQAAQVALPQAAFAPPPPPAAATSPTPPREGNPRAAELGLMEIQGQYLAYVRAKIYKVNEQIMPREWIKDVLTREVSADFEVVLARGGRLLTARLIRSSGYSELDNIAAQAIRTASPFEGYPPSAGDMLVLNVRIYYRPVYR